MFEDKFCIKDSILDSIDFEELIEMVQCNEKIINEFTITKCYNELLEMKLENAKEMFKSNMENILKECI